MENSLFNQKGSVGRDAKTGKEDEKVIYPDGLTNSEAIRNKIEEIELMYTQYKELVANARDRYKAGFDFLKAMGEFQLSAINKLKDIGEEVEVLKVLLVTPDFDKK